MADTADVGDTIALVVMVAMVVIRSVRGHYEVDEECLREYR